MAFTKEQRLLVLMAIACMGLAVVSAGCGDSEANREVLKSETNKRAVKLWCACPEFFGLTWKANCRIQAELLYNQTNAQFKVNCSGPEDYQALMDPVHLCVGFNESVVEVTTTPTTTTTTTTTTPPPDTSTTSNGTTTSPPTDASTTSNGTTTSPPTDASTTSNGTTTSLPTDETKPTFSTSSKPTTTTTSKPETGSTYLYWLIPLIVLLLAAMFLLGCYLHRRTKGSRGFHHSTKTNGSTKATNGDA